MPAPAFETVLLHSNLNRLQWKRFSDMPTGIIVIGQKLNTKERKLDFWFIKRTFLVAVNRQRKRGRSTRASPSPHHSFGPRASKERTASFIARFFSTLVPVMIEFIFVCIETENANKYSCWWQLQKHHTDHLFACLVDNNFLLNN